jgi:hypothetical protein
MREMRRETASLDQRKKVKSNRKKCEGARGRVVRERAILTRMK